MLRNWVSSEDTGYGLQVQSAHARRQSPEDLNANQVLTCVLSPVHYACSGAVAKVANANR
jgi:hypothetical protein